MAGHEWDWFQREELIGQISDIRVQNLQVERENVQKRTFTRWINLHLEKCNPPLEVKDLFLDIQDGKILMALLEVLSGQNLLHEYKSSTHRIFRLNNIAKALKFLEDSNVKLVSIDAAEIVDGNSSLVLGLIWNIILFFQIKELTGNLNRNSSSSSLSSGPSGADSDTSHPSTPNTERSMSLSVKDQRKAIRALLTWVQRKTRKYGVAVQDFASSWRSGLAFLAIIKAIDSNLVDMKQALEKSARENLEDAFSIAQDHLGVPRLLEPEDVMVESPDEQSIMTYVAQFLEHFQEIEGEDFSDPDKKIPVETTYVHIKDAPSEQEGKILILNENGERTYTVSHERSHSPPTKVCIHDLPEELQSETADEEFNDKLNQLLSDNSQRVSEESLVLLSAEEPQRPTSLQITGSVSFESSSSWEVLSDKLIQNEGSISDDQLKQNDDLSATILPDQKNTVDTVDSESSSKEEMSPECNNEIKDSLVNKTWDSCSLSPLSQTSDAHTNEPRNLVENTEHITSTFLQENASKEEDIRKYVLCLLDEEMSKKLPDGYEHPKQSPVFQTVQDTNCSSKDSDLKGQMEISLSCKSENSTPPVTKIPENLDSHSEDGPSAKMSPNSLKVSVIPHDLFYYPHYNVPISAVLEAFAKPSAASYVSENSKICGELSMNYLHEEEPLVLNNERGILDPGLQTNLSVSPAELVAEDIEEEKVGPDSPTKSSSEKVQAVRIRKNVELKEDSSISTNSQDSTNPENLEVMVDQLEDIASAMLRSEISSKRKEKKKNVIQAENFQTSETGTTQLPDKQKEEIIDYQEFSRVSYSDSSVYLRKRIPNPSEKEHVSENKQKKIDMDESTNLLIIRKKKDLEAPENAIPPLEPPCVEQPELFYFIVFLWVLVYCLLLLPHLVSNKF
ncbi:calmin isoform X1 [Gopherus evgoodei]|uniref:calmin isoform X1 n=1 Tax=Gopherus evgoodei TaxID=1825980 RepID=UPI0011CED734|nr:calmin isoform X1 [Gopherus evgoodei]